MAATDVCFIKVQEINSIHVLCEFVVGFSQLAVLFFVIPFTLYLSTYSLYIIL